MKSKLMSLSKIKLNPSNPRVIKDHKFQKLVKSIKDFPEMLEIRPIVVNDDMIVLGGNMRLKACIEAGLKEVPVIIAEFDESKQSEFIIKDNIGYGEWDWDLLANDFEPAILEDWGLDVWVPKQDVNLDGFFKDENKEESDASSTKIILEYTQEDHDAMMMKLNELGGSKEDIIYKLVMECNQVEA